MSEINKSYNKINKISRNKINLRRKFCNHMSPYFLLLVEMTVSSEKKKRLSIVLFSTICDLLTSKTDSASWTTIKNKLIASNFEVVSKIHSTIL